MLISEEIKFVDQLSYVCLKALVSKSVSTKNLIFLGLAMPNQYCPAEILSW